MQQVIWDWTGKTITGSELVSNNYSEIEVKVNALFPWFQIKKKHIIKIIDKTSGMTGSCRHEHFMACKHPFIPIIQSNINPRDTLLVETWSNDLQECIQGCRMV